MNRSAASRITGRTRLFGVLGDPVVQVRSPELLNSQFDRLAADAVLVPIHARSSDLADVVHGLQLIGNLDGLFVTVPHKVAICALADRLSPAAALSGSANVLRRDPDGHWYAENFDGVGFVHGLAAEGHNPVGRTVALVGVGGAGSAIAAALLEAGVSRLRVCDRDPYRLAELRARLSSRWPRSVDYDREPVLDNVDLVVNATPLGLAHADELPFGIDSLRRDTVVADIIMTPQETRLLSLAASRGNPVHYGIHMLNHQISAYLTFFGIGGDTGGC